MLVLTTSVSRRRTQGGSGLGNTGTRKDHDMIDNFRGEYGFLSNFHPSPIEWHGATYPTAEHLFQALKTGDKEEREAIRTAPMPNAAKRLGRKCSLRPDWDERKVGIMRTVVCEKFLQNRDLLDKLLDTAGNALIERNTWGDTFWGKVGDEGLNHLGLILMEIRDLLGPESADNDLYEEALWS